MTPQPGPAGPAAFPVATVGPVLVLGTGLLGASVGMGLRVAGVEVLLEDPSRMTAMLAQDLGAGRLVAPDDAPRLVVVAAPVDVTADAVEAALSRFPDAVVTDVASVKGSVVRALTASGADLTRYVGSHPMAGSERSGPTAARPDLFTGRPWVVVPTEASRPDAVMAVRTLATDLGAVPTIFEADAHDRAVALVSHVPQVAASLVAARLQDADGAALDLAGQGLRDTTRIAASDPRVWTGILATNAAGVVPVLRSLRDDLDALIDALGQAASGEAHARPAQGVLGVIAGAVAAGNAGVARIPGKHGGARTEYDVVTVIVPDEPGALARLLADIGAAGINLEDLAIDHAPRQRVGLASVSVLRGLGPRLTTELGERQWRVVG